MEWKKGEVSQLLEWLFAFREEEEQKIEWLLVT